MVLLIAGFMSFLVAYLLTPMIAGMLKEAGFLRPNYRKEDIPVGVGMVFVLTYLVMSPLLIWWSKEVATTIYIALFATFALTFLGVVDDTLGSRSASGLKGHLMKLLREGQLTTGGLKALMGGMVALAVVAGDFSGEVNLVALGKWLLQGLLVALSINSINLLDLRPGRAGKGFVLGAVVLLVIGWQSLKLLPLAVILGTLLAYLPQDLRAQAMMGDTGANALGVTFGYSALWVLSWHGQLALLVFLIAFHIYTEKYSLTKVIEKNKVLNYLDMLGR